MENLKTIYYIDQIPFETACLIQNEVEEGLGTYEEIMRKYGFILKNLNY